jgi:purine-nucleoside phosphorylase
LKTRKARWAKVEALAAELEAREMHGFEVALVLGSGLGTVTERIEEARVVPFEELETMPRSAVPGHAGRFVRGLLAGCEVLVQQGRVHLYEGWSAADVTRAVRAFARLGARVLVLTNAAGGLDPALPVPRLMRVRDHINRQARTPLAPSEAGRGTPYDAELGELLEATAARLDIRLTSGVYAGLLGPNYESPAEIRFLARCGVDAVGMSTVAEALAGHAEGLAVCALSAITNHAAGLGEESLSHDEVVTAGARIAYDLGRLLESTLPEMRDFIAARPGPA